jgi:integrase
VVKRVLVVDPRRPLQVPGDVERIGPEHLDGYVTAKLAEGLSPKTDPESPSDAQPRVPDGPAVEADPREPTRRRRRPKLVDPETVILSEDEAAALLKTYRELAARAETLEEGLWWELTRRMVLIVLGTALRRGELLALRWCNVDMLERRLHVRRSWVRNEMTTPKSRSSRRTVDFGLKTSTAFSDQWQASLYRGPEDLVFCHPDLDTPLDPSELTRSYVKPVLTTAGITKKIQPWHGLRHTALTMDAAVGNPNAYVQAKAGHSQFSITERYVHAAQVAFPGAVDRSEARLFGEVDAEVA